MRKIRTFLACAAVLALAACSATSGQQGATSSTGPSESQGSTTTASSQASAGGTLTVDQAAILQGRCRPRAREALEAHLVASSSRIPYLRLVNDSDTADVNDAVLRRALVRRERWAAAAVWKRFAPRVFSIFSRSLPRSTASGELTQEVMLRALDDASRGRRVKCLSSLVYGQTARVLRREFRLDALRRRYWPRSRTKAAELALVFDRTERAALLKLYDALDQLSAADRVLFVLHEFELLSDVEIADAVDLPLQKTRRRLARALGKVERAVDCDPLLAAYLCAETSLERDLREGA